MIYAETLPAKLAPDILQAFRDVVGSEDVLSSEVGADIVADVAREAAIAAAALARTAQRNGTNKTALAGDSIVFQS